jgi:predicted metal-dependent hydrolase
LKRDNSGTKRVLETLSDFHSLLLEERYFEAHEVLEKLWRVLRARRDPLHNCLKGLINAAIAFEHIKRGRRKSLSVAPRAYDSYILRASSAKEWDDGRLEKLLDEIRASIEKRWSELNGHIHASDLSRYSTPL